MENPAHCFTTGIHMSNEGNGDHSNHGCDGGKLLSCELPSDTQDYESKNDTISLINDITHKNSVCFNSSIQDGDQTDLFYNIVCGSDLPVGENVSVSSPQPDTNNCVQFNEVPSLAFSDEVNGFPSVDVIVHGMDEPLDNIDLSVPDFKLCKSSDSQTDVLTIQMEEQQKKLNESISAIAKSLGMEDFIPETFSVDSSKDVFPVNITSDNMEEKVDQTVQLHLSELSMQFSTDSDLLDCYDAMSPKKKKESSSTVPIVISNSSAEYVICSQDETNKSAQADTANNNLFSNMCFQDLEDPGTSNYVTIDSDNMSFDICTNDEASWNIIPSESVECVFQDTSADLNEPQNSVCSDVAISEVNVSDLLSQVLEESQDKIGSEPTTVSITSDTANKKMQIILMTSRGEQIIEINTDNLNLEPASPSLTDVGNNDDYLNSSSDSNKISPSKTSVSKSDKCLDIFDEMDEELMCEEDLIEFVKKITPARGKRKSWICPIEGCGQMFYTEYKLRVHMINHKGARPYKCNVDGCDWAFTTLYRLRRHCETHIGKKDYICDFQGCDRRFTTIYNLKTHRKRHTWPNSLICPAEGCTLNFANRRKLELHLRVHDDIEAPYKCSVCGKRYYSANCVASHYRTHQYSEDDFKCPFDNCGKKFDKFCRLKQHVRHHTGERPYSCPAAGCKWSFTSASKLTRHMRKHTGERKFVCTEPGCGKSFMRPEHLKGHIVIHSGDKPFQCPHENCNARFTAKSSLYVHVKKHCASGLKIVYPCPITPCLKKYNNKATLKQHIQKVHPSVLSDGKQVEMPEKVELTVPVSISVANDLHQDDYSVLSSTNDSSNHSFLSKDIITSMPIITQPIHLKKVNSSSKEGQRNLKFVIPTNRSNSTKNSSTALTDLTSGRLLQENRSGSARTDYCCNRLGNNTKKLWSLQNRVRLGLLHQNEDTRLDNTSLPSPTGHSSISVRSPDVLLASSSVALQDSANEPLVQNHFLHDDPTSIYHEDSMLVTSSEFVSELPLSSSLLSDNSDSNSSSITHNTVDPSFSASNSVDFTVSSINLQCLD